MPLTGGCEVGRELVGWAAYTGGALRTSNSWGGCLACFGGISPALNPRARAPVVMILNHTRQVLVAVQIELGRRFLSALATGAVVLYEGTNGASETAFKICFDGSDVFALKARVPRSRKIAVRLVRDVWVQNCSSDTPVDMSVDYAGEKNLTHVGVGADAKTPDGFSRPFPESIRHASSVSES